jgi:NarL family two-component system response regulator LiaR
MAETQTIRVLLVDEHELVLSSLTIVIETMVGIQVVGHATDGSIAVQKVADLLPDVVLMDIAMPVMDGLTATRIIHEKHPDIRIIVLTASILENNLQAALEAGACAYLSKDSGIDDIEMAIRNAVQ